MNRRQFVKRLTSVGLAVAAARLPLLSPQAWAAQGKGDIPYRQLGNTGEKVSVVGLGGWHLGFVKDEQESIRIIRTAIDNGINFLDNCWDYHDGKSEIRMGKALRDGYRQKAFLMTKIDGHTREAATKQLDECLRRLQTDTIDLLQFHEVIRLSDPARIFSPNGAFEAMIEAKIAGKIRYIGFTGHKSPDIHLKMLETCLAHNFNPATVQMPLNVMDAHYNSFEKKVLPELVKHGVGPLGMKSMGSPYILKSNTVTPMECLHYAMNLPVSVVITGCDSMPILEQALTAARTFKPLSQQKVVALLAKTAKAAAQGKYELYKTTDNFDGTARNPQWLG